MMNIMKSDKRAVLMNKIQNLRCEVDLLEFELDRLNRKDIKSEIRVWMIRNGYTNTIIEKDLKLTNSAVCQFVKGNYKSTRLTEYFVNRGCPTEFFDNCTVKVN